MTTLLWIYGIGFCWTLFAFLTDADKWTDVFPVIFYALIWPWVLFSLIYHISTKGWN